MILHMIKSPCLVLTLALAFGCGTFAIVTASFSQQPSLARKTFKEPDDGLDGFIGRVKTIYVETEEHEFTTHFMDFANRYRRTPYQTSQFDRQGRRIEKFNYRTDGVPLPKTTFTYDADGVLLRENHHSAVSGKPYLETIYVYDSKGRVSEEIGKNIEDGKVFSRKLYSHNEAENYTDIQDYDSDDVLRGKIRFGWDEQGRVREVATYSPSGDVRGKGTVTYDERGNLSGIILTATDDSGAKREKYTYELDGQGNWTKKTLYHWVTEKGKSSFKLMNITHRTITYY